MRFVVTDAALEEHLRACRAPLDVVHRGARIAREVEAAWHLRQRDPQEAQQMCLRLAADLGGLPTRDREALEARLGLVRAEVDLQMSRVESARAHAAASLRAFEALGDPLGAADALYVGAQVEHDSGARDDSSSMLAAAGVRARVAGDALRGQLFDANEAVFAASASIVAAEARWRPFIEGCLSETADDALDGTSSGQDDAMRLALRAIAHDYVGTVAISRGDNRSCVEALGWAVDAYRQVGLERRATVCTCNLAGALSNLVDHAGALERLSEAIERARPRQVPRDIGICLIQSAHTLCELGNIDAAREQILEAKEALAGLTRIGSYTVLLQVLGEVEFAHRHFDAALEAYRAQEDHALARGSAMHQVLALRQQVEVLGAMGQRDRAIGVAHSALGLVRLLGNPLVESEILFALGGVFDDGLAPAPEGSPWPNSELHWLHEALEVAGRAGLPTIRSDLLTRLGEAHARQGDFEQAYDFSRRAAEARRREHTEETTNRAIAMEVRHRTERTRAQLAHHSQLAQEQAGRAEELARTSDTLALLGIVGREVTAQLDDHQVFEALGRHLNGLLDAPSFALFLLSDDGRRLELAYGVEEGHPVQVAPIDIDDATAGSAQCARTREEVYLTRRDVPVESGLQVPDTLPIRSALYSPLLVGDRLLGVMTLQSVQPDAYDQRDRLVLRTLSAYGAIALDNARAYKRLAEANARLSEMSLTDALTGLRNRRFLMQQLDADVALSLRAYADARPARPVSDDIAFFLIDLDHFKQVNDTHGHPAGDAVLAQMRDRLAAVCRDGDYLARWGGEEFLVVARHISRDRALALGERLRQAVGAAPFALEHGELAITASIGFACFPADPSMPAAATWQDVVDAADRALYEAKQAGRDAVRGRA